MTVFVSSACTSSSSLSHTHTHSLAHTATHTVTLPHTHGNTLPHIIQNAAIPCLPCNVTLHVSEPHLLTARAMHEQREPLHRAIADPTSYCSAGSDLQPSHHRHITNSLSAVARQQWILPPVSEAGCVVSGCGAAQSLFSLSFAHCAVEDCASQLEAAVRFPIFR
jgi:hypothetical protein